MRNLILTICIILSISQSQLSGQEIDATKVKFDKKPLIVFDDKILVSNDELQKIDPLTVQEIVVIKDNSLENYITKYGSDAKNGLVLVYSKDYVAMRWYKTFAEYNKKLKKIISNNNFQYLDYSVYLNKEPLKDDFFDGLEKRLENHSIKKVKYYKIKNNKGKIRISIKP